MAVGIQEAFIPVEFVPSPELYPFGSKWFASSVGRVHYIDEGAGRPIVFSHGQPMWSFLYRHIVIGLRDQFRCVVIDYPGYGLSVRPDGYGYTPREHAGVLGELVEHLGLDDMVVMGQDWGGPIVMSMAAKRPRRITGIVLGNTWSSTSIPGRCFRVGECRGLESCQRSLRCVDDAGKVVRFNPLTGRPSHAGAYAPWAWSSTRRARLVRHPKPYWSGMAGGLRSRS